MFVNIETFFDTDNVISKRDSKGKEEEDLDVKSG